MAAVAGSGIGGALVCKRPYPYLAALLAFCRRKMGTLLLSWQRYGVAAWSRVVHCRAEKASLPTDSEGQGGGSFKHTGLFWALFLISRDVIYFLLSGSVWKKIYLCHLRRAIFFNSSYRIFLRFGAIGLEGSCRGVLNKILYP